MEYLYFAAALFSFFLRFFYILPSKGMLGCRKETVKRI